LHSMIENEPVVLKGNVFEGKRESLPGDLQAKGAEQLGEFNKFLFNKMNGEQAEEKKEEGVEEVQNKKLEEKENAEAGKKEEVKEEKKEEKGEAKEDSKEKTEDKKTEKKKRERIQAKPLFEHKEEEVKGEAGKHEEVKFEEKLSPETIKEIEVLNKLKNHPAVKLILELEEQGKDVVAEIGNLSKLNPANLTPEQKYRIKINRDAEASGITLTETDITNAMNDFEVLAPHEKAEKVAAINSQLKSEFEEKGKNYNILNSKTLAEAKTQPKPEELIQSVKDEYYPLIESLKGKKDYAGVEINDEVINEWKDAILKPSWLNKNGTINQEKYLEAVFLTTPKLREKSLNALADYYLAEGVELQLEQDTNSGSMLGNRGAALPGVQEKTSDGSGIEFHADNLPGVFSQLIKKK